MSVAFSESLLEAGVISLKNGGNENELVPKIA